MRPLTLACVLFVPGLLQAQGKVEKLTFEEHVRPLLKAHCFDCHGDQAKPKGGLDLRLARLTAQGGDSGPGFVAGMAKAWKPKPKAAAAAEA